MMANLSSLDDAKVDDVEESCARQMVQGGLASPAPSALLSWACSWSPDVRYVVRLAAPHRDDVVEVTHRADGHHECVAVAVGVEAVRG